MASTFQLQRSISTAQQTVGGYPLTGVLSVANEPAFSFGDWVREFILSPPFAWRWNRSHISFSTVAAQQDYSLPVPTFGWLEKATLSDGAKPYEMENELCLADAAVQQRPLKISAQYDDDSGNITFRFLPVPDRVYTASVIYQNAAPSFSSVNGLWTPIPDFMFYIYNQGFLAKTLEYLGDPRYVGAMQLFLRLLTNANGGLTESQKNLFISEQQIQARRQGPPAIRATEREAVQG